MFSKLKIFLKKKEVFLENQSSHKEENKPHKTKHNQAIFTKIPNLMKQ